MEYVKIFLASSIIRFHNERLEIADCIRALNDRYVDKGIYFKLFICEDESKMLSMTRKQDDYNDKIKVSDYFYLFVADAMGQYTEEEFNVALEQFQKTQAPQIYTYFYQTESVDELCKDFMTRLDVELGHYYSVFSNVDSVKLHMLMELISDPRVNNKASVEFKNGVASVDDVPMVFLDQVPSFSKNKALQENIMALDALNKEFAQLAVAFAESPQNMAILGKLSENTTKRNDLQKKINDAEKMLFDIMKMTCDRENKGSWRIQQARREIESGNYEGALNILRDAQRSKELKSAEEKIDQLEKFKKAAILDIRNYMEENLMRIQTIQLAERGNDGYSEILRLYEENFDLYLKYRIGEKKVIDYLQYLLAHNQNNDVINAVSRIRESQISGDPDFMAAVLNKESIALVSMNRLNEAKKVISTALVLADRQASDHNHEKLVMDILFNYGNVLFALNEYTQAQEYFLSVYQMMQASGDTDRESIGKSVEICTSIGSLYSDLNKRVEAEEYYIKAANQIDKLTDLSIDEIKNKMILFNNLAVLAVQKNDLLMAEKYIDSSMQAADEGGEKDPIAFLAYRSMLLLNEGMILYRKGNPESAKRNMEEALRIRELLSQKEYESFVPLIATTCHNLGIIASGTDSSESNAFFDRAAFIENELTEKQADIFRVYATITKITKTAFAAYRTETDFEECISMAERLVEDFSPAYRSYLGMALTNAGKAFYQQGNKAKALHYLNNAYEVYSWIARFTGEKNQTSSYEDIMQDIKHSIDVIQQNSQDKITGMWYMERYELWNGQITAMPVRAQRNLDE